MSARVLLIITGGIAAYKSLEWIRLWRKAGGRVTPVLTASAQQFVTPLAAASLAESPAYTTLFSLKDETEMGHIRLSRTHDLVLVAPASADFLARAAHGLADDLATTVLLASNKPVLFVPAMNPQMWQHPATQRNIQQLQADGAHFLMPEAGEAACGETGIGRMAEPAAIVEAVEALLACHDDKPLYGKTAIVTSGGTQEPIDPVRTIGNRSSGKQGHAIAAALRDAGADVRLICGTTTVPEPYGVTTIAAPTANAMQQAVLEQLPADIVVMAAAVADWQPDCAPEKIKKQPDQQTWQLSLRQTPDILAMLCQHPQRPPLVIGFAAETDAAALANAEAKRRRKGCDWLVVNGISLDNPVFGCDDNTVTIYDDSGKEQWPTLSKTIIAQRLVTRIIHELS